MAMRDEELTEVRERARLLKAAGHAISYSEVFEQEGTRVVGYTFTHYLTCGACERNKKEKQHDEEREVVGPQG